MNEKVIWDFLIEKTKNAYGTAALMGNLMAESSLNPACATGTKNKDYVEDANEGKIDFVYDKVAFGLVQWCYWSRKKALLDYAKSKDKSVGDLMMQLEFMWDEIQKYASVYAAIVNATNIREASDVIMLRYEKPATTTEAMKERRAKYGQKFYDEFAGGKPDPKPTPTKKKMVVATANVNVRHGNDKSYSRCGLLLEGQSREWVATSENGWYAIRFGSYVCWVSGEFAKVE